MTEPTPEQIEAVAVAIVDEEMRLAGTPQHLRDAAAKIARDLAVRDYGSLARVAIIAYQGTLQ